MLCSFTCISSNTVFDRLPDTTNVVESHNRCSKESLPDILKIAMMSTYKINMAAALEHQAKEWGISTSYVNLSQQSRAQRSKVANKARSCKRVASDDAEGPPDKRQIFKKGLLLNFCRRKQLFNAGIQCNSIGLCHVDLQKVNNIGRACIYHSITTDFF